MKLLTHQIRVLRALAAEEGKALSRPDLCKAIGWNEKSGTLNKALRGVPPTVKTDRPYPGLLGMGLVVKLELDVDGFKEVMYKLTDEGVEEEKQHQGELKPMRDKGISTNNRYREIEG